MKAFQMVQEGDAWVWRLVDGDVVAQGIFYADRRRAEQDLQTVCEGGAPPQVFAVMPGRWAWGFTRLGQRLGTTAKLFDEKEQAYQACLHAMAVGEAAAQKPWVWVVDTPELAPIGASVIKAPSSSRAGR